MTRIGRSSIRRPLGTMKSTYSGKCHCGNVRFEVDADIDHVRICDCSICRKRGALIHRVPSEDVRMLTPLSELALYQWGSFTAKDYFCPTCGILPFRRSSQPTDEEVAHGIEPFDGWAINTRCLEGFDYPAVPIRTISGSRIRLA